MQGNAWVATMVTHKEHYNNRDINIHKDVIKCYRMLDNNIGQKWPICTSYYTLSMAYCVYCTRPDGAKRPRASAVKYAIRHLRACSKWFIAI